jgi:hypothetical protein
MDEEEQQGVSVHAGFPNPATDKSLRSLDLNQLLIEHSVSTYYFRIRGEQWSDVGIMDGDIAIVDRALDARPTDLIIWWRDGDDGFSVSTPKDMPKTAVGWGVVTATIHQFRKPAARAKKDKK